MDRALAAALAAAAGLVLLAGCAAPRGEGQMDRADLRERAERVFREQNRASTRVMGVLPGLRERDPEAYERLSTAEGRMLEACEPLNRIAVAHRDEQAAGLWDKINVPASLAECARRTERVETLIRELATPGS